MGIARVNGARESRLGVLIIDTHVMVRAGLRMLIEQEPGMRIVGEAADVPVAARMAASARPDVILMDQEVGQHGQNMLPELLTLLPHARVLILTSLHDPEVHRAAVRQGALGVLSTDQPPAVLLKAIRKVRDGEVWLDRAATSRLLADMRARALPQDADSSDSRIQRLSDRERQVLVLVSQGLRNAAIADRLGISTHTVRHHLSSILEKLGVSDRLELIPYAYRHGLVNHSGSPTSREGVPGVRVRW